MPALSLAITDMTYVSSEGRKTLLIQVALLTAACALRILGKPFIVTLARLASCTAPLSVSVFLVTYWLLL